MRSVMRTVYVVELPPVPLERQSLAGRPTEEGMERTPLRERRNLDDAYRVVCAAADEDGRGRVELERCDGEVVRVQHS